MPLTTPNFVAGGDVYPGTPVYIDSFTSGDNTSAIGVLQATDATKPVLGVAGMATDYPPINDSSHVTVSAKAAVATEPVRIFGVGEVCMAKVATGGVTAGKLVVAGGNSSTTYGVTDAAELGTQYTVGLALQTNTVVNSWVLIQVMPGVSKNTTTI